MNDGVSLVRDFAHELRNAISPARSAVDVLQVRGSDPGVLAKSLAHINRSLDAALRTIDAFVAADRVMDGTLSLDIRPLSLDDLIGDAAAQAIARDDRETPRFRLPAPDPSTYVNVDREQATAALASVLEHARVLGAGRGDVGVTTEQDAAHALLRIRFRSSTPAAPVAGFDSFRSVPGVGVMALRTARQIVELQRGTLVEHDSDATGAREFVLTLPRASAPVAEGIAADAGSPPPDAQKHHERATANGSTRVSILFVDDNAALRTTYAEALTALGYDVVGAADGEAAIELARKRVPDVALVDIHLPTVSGYEVARALSADPATAGIRLVMLSGMTLDETTKRLSLSAGFDDCIDKLAGPAALDELLRGGAPTGATSSMERAASRDSRG